MELAKTVNVFMAMNLLANLKENVEALEVAIEAMEVAKKDEKHLLVLKELKRDYFVKQKDLEDKLKDTQINLY